MMKRKTIVNLGIMLVILALVAFGVYYLFYNKKDKIVQIKTAQVREEILYKEVLATGTINPIDVVDVGTQVSGTISLVMVDFNQHVKKGQILARMDTKNLVTNVNETLANVQKAEINLNQAKVNYNRAERLLEKGAVSKSYFEDNKLQYDNAVKNLEIVRQQLDRNKVGLSYATIISPIDGIIISRDVDEGQTVAASFATPTLFRIANNLSKMKIEASVDEADIGQIKKGQEVSYTVDAFPEIIFKGTTEEVQMQPIVVQNVVTYKVIVLIENKDLKLIPGMTATLTIKTSKHEKAATVPDAAISFKLSDDEIKMLKKFKYKVVQNNNFNSKNVWVKMGNILTEKSITPSFTNGINTAITEHNMINDSIITRITIIDPNIKPSSGGIFSGNSNKKEEDK